MSAEKKVELTKKEIWDDFISCVRKLVSTTTFGNWIECINFIDNGSNQIDLEFPNVFVEEYFVTNHLNLLKEKLYLHFDVQPKLNFSIKENILKKSQTDIDRINQYREKMKQENMQRSFNVGEKYRDACLANWESEEACQKILVSWFTDKNPFFVFMGNPGTGKTFLCAAVLNVLLEQDEDVYYLSHMSFVHTLHKAIDDKKNVSEIVNRFSQYRYLIIDDIGSGACSEWQKEVILGLIDKRYSNNAKTLITTNLNEEKLYKDLGYRTASRLLDVNNYNIQDWGSDRRKIRY